MPMLPTEEVTAAQAERVMAAFGSVGIYLAWLRRQVVEYVISHEQRQQAEEFRTQRQGIEQEIKESFGIGTS